MFNKQQLHEELFKAIVIDRNNKNFKVISGDYKDKKALSDTYVDDYIIRKVYKKEVFDWILKNAKTSLDAYILLSTSYKKWVNKDITRDYYHKIRKDLPVLTYEESAMENPIKSMIRETADSLDYSDILNSLSTDEPSTSRVELFVKGLLGKDKIEVLIPVGQDQDEIEAMYSNQDVANAVAELRSRHPQDSKLIYYSIDGSEPTSYIEL